MKIPSPDEALWLIGTKEFLMKLKNKKMLKILTYIGYLLVVIFVFLAISAKFSILGLHLLVVKSGSMEPTIKTGSLIIDKAEPSYKIGDIITFKNPTNLAETITHRIDDIKSQSLVTKGDANNAPDADEIDQAQIIGKVIFKIPYFGYVVAFARTTPGLIILIIIPATIIIYEEINKIKKEIKARRKSE